MNIRFKLRLDMPEGFKKNEQYPELPAILGYLIPYDKQEFASLKEFHKQVLSGTIDYLEKQKIPAGEDPKLREGLAIKKLKERFQTSDGGWDYSILTPATNRPGVCVFGGLEKLS